MVFAHDVHDLLAFHQGLQRAAEAREVAVEQAVDLAVMRSRGIEQGDLRHGRGALAEGLARAAEPGHFANDRQMRLRHRAVAPLVVIGLKTAALGQDDRPLRAPSGRPISGSSRSVVRPGS